MPKRVLVALVLLHGVVLLGAPQEAPDTKRLVAIGKLWGTVKYFHPYVAYRDIDWDKALIDALPRLRNATTSAEYDAAVSALLDALHDPATYAVEDTPNHSNASLKTEHRSDGTLVVSQSDSAQAAPDATQQLIQALTSSGNVLFDLRVAHGAPPFLSTLIDNGSVSKLLTRTTAEGYAQRTWIHNGLPPATQQYGNAGYNTAFYTTAGTHVEGDPGARKHKIAFLLNESAPLPPIGCALWAQGKASVLAESPHYRFADVISIIIPMGFGVTAVLRLSEPVGSRQVESVTHEDALTRAIAALARPDVASAQSPLPAAPSPRADLAYNETRYPSTEYRILAAYKIWGAFHNFFAYRDLMDEDWDDVFATFLPKFIAAKDAREYNLTTAEMITHVSDSHAFINSEELSEYFGKAPVGLRLRLIERKPVITEVLDPEAVKEGIHPGDIVTRIDGENITDRFHREGRYIAASTAQALGSALMQRILNGPEDSEATLNIEATDERSREVHLKRSSSYLAALGKQRTGEVMKLLPGNIGYADLDRLMPQQVDGMFDQFRSTSAIIFDMRGYPHSTASSIAPRLTDRRDVPAAIFNGPLSLTPDLSDSGLTSSASYFFVQKLPTTDKWKYKGKTVMLIDERTMSEAEHTGLFFEAANKTEFIGTPSAGANGDVTNFVVPGGITIWFSGHDVRHANGGPLQRLGLQPAVTVAPTIRAIREGRDEVLETAVEYLTPEGVKGGTRRMATLHLPPAK